MSVAARTGLPRVSEAAVRAMSDADLTGQTGWRRRRKTDQEGRWQGTRRLIRGSTKRWGRSGSVTGFSANLQQPDLQTSGKGFTGRGGNEGIQLGFGYPCAGSVALTLDGAVSAVAFGSNEVNTDATTGEIRPHRDPFRLQPDIGETVPVKKVPSEVRLHQAFKSWPFLAWKPETDRM